MIFASVLDLDAVMQPTKALDKSRAIIVLMYDVKFPRQLSHQDSDNWMGNIRQHRQTNLQESPHWHTFAITRPISNSVGNRDYEIWAYVNMWSGPGPTKPGLSSMLWKNVVN